MNIRKLTAFIAACAVCAFVTACSNDSSTLKTEESVTEAVSAAATEAAADSEILNFSYPVQGEEIAVMTVKDFGVIKIKLFPEEVPEAVENFKGLANINYYDELIFHRVIPHFMNQGGDPKGNGTGGNSIWGGEFNGGVSDKLYHFSGAVAYANSQGPTTNTSQFYIVNTDDGEMNLGGAPTIEALGPIPANVKQMYEEKGGTPFLDGGYTVFGQVFEGMDVVRAISQVETNPDNDKPVKQVLIESVRIVKYGEEDAEAGDSAQ